jgi:hypothetical protein
VDGVPVDVHVVVFPAEKKHSGNVDTYFPMFQVLTPMLFLKCFRRKIWQNFLVFFVDITYCLRKNGSWSIHQVRMFSSAATYIQVQM